MDPNNSNTAANNHSTNDNVSSASSSSSTAAASTLTTSTTTSSAVNNTAGNNNNTLSINSTMIPPPIPPGPPNYTTTGGGEVSTKQASTTAKPPQQQQQGPHLLNDCQQQQILEQFMQQQQQTLARHYHHQMMAAAAVNDPHHHHLHHILQQDKYMTASHRGYPQATGTSTSQQQQQQPQYVDIGSTTDQSSAAAAATTAYLVQTPNGSALLIPPPFLNQALVSTTSSSLTRAPNPSAAAATAAATSTMNPYGITTIPLTHSPSINLNLASHHHLIRPESTASTNVYQTIDAAEKNGYLYPMESFYETSALTSTNSPSTLQQPLHHHNCSTRHKSTKNRQQQQQQSCLQYHHHIQQQQSQTNGGQFIKLIEAACSSSSSSSSSSSNTKSNNNSTNMTGTLHSNTNNTNQTATTNSNFFVSPALSATSNRRFDNSSILERLKYRLTKSFGVSGKCCCSWKFLAIFFLILTVNFLAFTIYLSVMRFYNLNWHLKENQVASKHQLISERRLTNAILFSKIGDIVDDKIAPYDFFNTQIYLDSANYVKFNLSLNRNAQIGFYAEKNSPPTFTKFKYFENFDANTLVTRAQKINYEKRLLTSDQQDTMVNTGFVHYLEDGLWYISLYNDNKSPLKFRLKTDFYNYESKICPLNCHGKGDCVNGKCKCYPGFSGIDCSLSSCPLLCSGHGKYENGRCVCDLDWHGNECQVPIERCEVANCNGNGECINGICICYVGYRGKNCDQLGCRSENCSNNGVCIEGQCRCFQNYTGSDCNEQIQTSAFSSVAALSSTICSSHGEFDYTARRCKCESGWSGSDCSRNDNCLDKACTVCRNGFGGLFCLDRTPLRCDPRCNEHGVCMNGTCTCSPGYHGRHCDINSCPKSCSSNGQCERISNTHRYQCVCNKGWTGVACESAVELLCNDNIDNDSDGLVDCMDSECCSVDNCKLSLACTSSPEPKDRLLRKQPPSLSATFFEKMKFLIEDDSVQSFAYPSTFAESQVSIIRGQVLFKNGQPLIGVKVSILSNPTYGYTLTRYNGIFDMMVNGGGSVLLEFTRQGLKTRIVSVSTTWNQFSHIDPVRMYLVDDDEEDDEESDNRDSEDSTTVLRPSPCASDNNLEYHRLRPIVQTSLLGGTTTMSSPLDSNLPVRPESGVLHSRVPLGDTTLSLVYTSSQSAGYQSTLFVLLTPETIPDRLRVVHLRIEIEGVLHRIKFDAVEMLRYEFAWDRRNAYEQRVYGLTWAKVRVGYEYEGGCGNDNSKKSGGFIHWESVVVKLAGYDLGSSEIGSWNIDVHHRLNTQQGILHKGDGSTIYVKEIQKSVEIVAGRLRLKRDIDIDCTVDCEQAKFYSPYSLSVNKDGLVFVGDFNYVWMLNSTQTPKVVLELSKDQPYKYHMTNDPLKGNLFISDALNSRIISLRALDPNQSDLKSNFKLIIGDQDQRKSRQNRFIHPKSLAFDTNGAVIYYIDSNEVRSIAIGSTGPSQLVISGSRGDEKPSFECKPVQSVSEAQLRWPTALAISPLDNSLYILDDGDLIYRVTPSNTVELVAGVPTGCEDDTSHFKPLNRVVDMSFAPDGDLFLLENDGQIRVVRSSRQIEVFLADNFAGFNDPVSIAVHPNRSVYVLDRGDNVLYHVKPSTLRRQSDSDDFYGGKYTVVSPDTREAFIFNRFGLHMHTMDLASGLMVYNFTYNGNALYGKLTAITDHAKTIVTVKRDFHGRAEFIQTSSGLTLKLKLNNFDMLRSLTTSNDNRSYIFNYMGNVGLLISRTEPNEKTTMYNYEKNGKVKEIIDPNQQSTNISYSINSNGLVTSMTSLGNTETWLMNSTSIQVYKNGKLDSQIDSSRLIYSSIRSLSSDDQLSLYRSSGVGSTVKAAKNSASKSGSKSKNANRKLVNVNKLT